MIKHFFLSKSCSFHSGRQNTAEICIMCVYCSAVFELELFWYGITFRQVFYVFEIWIYLDGHLIDIIKVRNKATNVFTNVRH